MFKPTGTPQPQKRYKDAHGALVTVESVSHNRVTFYREGINRHAYNRWRVS